MAIQRTINPRRANQVNTLHSPSGKKVKFNHPSAIELSETADFCVQLCIETLCKRATSVAQLTNFFFEFFNENFAENASLLRLYHSAKKSKMTKKSNQGGSCIKRFLTQLIIRKEKGSPSSKTVLPSPIMTIKRRAVIITTGSLFSLLLFSVSCTSLQILMG